MSASSASAYLHPVAPVSGTQYGLELQTDVVLSASGVSTTIFTASPLPIGTYHVEFGIDVVPTNTTTAVTQFYSFITNQVPNGSGGFTSDVIANQTIVNNLAVNQMAHIYTTLVTTYVSSGLNYITGSVYTGTLSGTTPSLSIDNIGYNYILFTKIA